jgi:hypothetical protein
MLQQRKKIFLLKVYRRYKLAGKYIPKHFTVVGFGFAAAFPGFRINVAGFCVSHEGKSRNEKRYKDGKKKDPAFEYFFHGVGLMV